MNRISLAVLLAFATASLCFAQAPSQEDLKKRREKFLQEPFLKIAPWILEYDKALAEAKRTGKPVFVFFTRSYADCPYCKQAEDGPLSDKGFPKFAATVVPYCHITTHIDGFVNDKLFEEKGGGGFPTFMMLDEKGDVIARHAGERTIPEFEKTAARAVFYLDARKKSEAGDKSAGIDFAIANLELGTYTAADAKRKIAEFGEPTPAQQAHLDAVLLNLEVTEIAKAAGADRVSSGKKFLEMKKAGRIPQGAQETVVFWDAILQNATSEKDVKGFEEALGKLREKLGANPNKKAFFDKQDAVLKEMKGKK